MLTRFKKLWNRYNPKRTYIDMDETSIALAASMGWIELYRGEWFFTKKGYAELEKAVEVFRADVRS